MGPDPRARSRAWTSSADLPMPGSPRTTSAPPSPGRPSSTASSTVVSAMRPTSSRAADEPGGGGRAAGPRRAPSLGAAGARAPVFRGPGVAAGMKPLRIRVLLVLVVAAVLALPGAAHAATAMCNVPITTGDGIVLRANIWLPSPTVGKVPTVLTVTGYNKDATNPTGQGCSGEGGIASADTSLADKGYAVMLVDDRGTGASQGKWDSWGERTQLDYQDILDWIQAQSWS